MPNPQTKAERINTGDRVQVFPVTDPSAAFRATVTDLGAWGPTLQIGTKVVFYPWAAVDRLERVDEQAEAPERRCATTWRAEDEEGSVFVLECVREHGHVGSHAARHDGRVFRAPAGRATR